MIIFAKNSIIMRIIILFTLVGLFTINLSAQTRRSSTTTRVKSTVTESNNTNSTKETSNSGFINEKNEKSNNKKEAIKTEITKTESAKEEVKETVKKQENAINKSIETSFLPSTETTKPKSNTAVSTNDEISFSSSSKPAATVSNSSAIANGQANTNSPAVARVLKYKADEKSVEYYNQLREKFEAEEKIRLEKEAADKIINAKKEEDARQARHLTDEQAPQFDKYRNGATNPVEKKTTVEEDYNKLFK